MNANREIPASARLILSLLIMAGVALLLPRHIQPAGRLLISWNAAVLAFLVTCAFTMVGRRPEDVRAHVKRESVGRYRVVAGTLLVCGMSLVAVTVVLNGITRKAADFRLQVFLCLATVFTAWLLLQTMFALFYARCYYREDQGNQIAGGLRFSGDAQPDYWDFLYFSYAIGTCYTTSDTNVESRRLRRAVLIQSLVSFVFYTILVGLLINAIGSLF